MIEIGCSTLGFRFDSLDTALAEIEAQGFRRLDLVMVPSYCPHFDVLASSAQKQDALQEKLGQMSASNGFEGRVVLIADDEMGESDCRVEWADGGVEREAGRIWRAIEEALNRYLAADGREAK